MKLTKISTLAAVAISAAILGFGGSFLLVRLGQPLPTSPTNLLVTLPVIAVVLVILAIPILRYQAAVKKALAQPTGTTRTPVKRVDPFYALRVALLAKAVAISGSVFFGWHGGVLIAVLTSPQIAEGAAWRSGFGLAGSVLMGVVGLVIERACRVPPDSSTTETEPSAA